MKNRKLYTILFLLIPGLCAGILRGTEMAYFFDWSTAMFGTYKAEMVLPLTVFATLLILGLLSVVFDKKLKSYCMAWRTPTVGGLAAGLLSAVLLMVSGWVRVYSSLKTERLSYVLFGIITIIAGIVFLFLSIARYRGTMPKAMRLFSSLPVFWSCFLLVLTYMEHPVEPVLRVFCYDIFAACFITLAVFYEIAPIFEEKSRRTALFFTVSAVYMVVMTLTGRVFGWVFSGDVRNLTDSPIRMLMFLAVGIRLVQNALCLMNRKGIREAKTVQAERVPELDGGNGENTAGTEEA